MTREHCATQSCGASLYTIWISAVLQKNLDDLLVAAAGGFCKCRVLAIVEIIWVRACFEQALDYIGVAFTSCSVQG
jgi:hypothetical protein